MSTNTSKEFVRCSICNKVVPKQQYCPKCGKLLIKNYKGPVQKLKEHTKISDEEKSNIEQLQKLNEKIETMESVRKKAIEEESKQEVIIETETEESVIGDDPVVKTMESKDIVIDDEEKGIEINLEDGFVFTPDKYTMDTVQKLAKNLKYQSQLVKMLADKELNEDIFMGLYKGKADDTHRLILRRSEIIREIDSSLGGYQSTIKVAEQGMKLLDIRQSIDEVSDEEYKVKAAAFKWDIDHYGTKIRTEEAKSTYLRNLGAMLDAEELEEITDNLNESLNLANRLTISDETKSKIQSSMKEALTLLKETNNS